MYTKKDQITVQWISIFRKRTVQIDLGISERWTTQINEKFSEHKDIEIVTYIWKGARGVMVTVVENGHGDTSSNLGRGCMNFPYH